MTDTDNIVKKPMWESIYHDTKTDTMFVWYDNNTQDVMHVNHRFFTPVLGEYNSKKCGMHDIFGNEMYEVIVESQDLETKIRYDHSGSTNHLSEIDIDFRTRWLQMHYQDVDMIETDMSKINICFLDIEVETTGRFPAAHRAEYPINCVTIYFSKSQKYYTFGIRDITDETKNKLLENNCEYISCTSEVDLLTKLFTAIGKNDVSILSGWNFSYDTTYLVNRAYKFSIPLNLMSRLPAQYKKAWVDKNGNLNIAGTEVIDFLALYKKYHFREEPTYKLDYIGEIECKEHKAPLPDGYKSWLNYWDQFILYNFQDVRLLTKIEQKAKMFALAVASCAEARVPFSSVFESKKMLVGFVLNMLHKDGLVFQPLKTQAKEDFPGAYVYSIPGYKESLVSYDYRSLYPSIIMTFNISPETKVIYPIDYVLTKDEENNLIRSPWTHNGKYQVFYRKDSLGIVPKVTRMIFNGRSELKKKMKIAKKQGKLKEADVFDMMQKVYKVLGNSLYGLLGTPYFQLYDIDNAASITSYGQLLIKDTVKNLVHYINNELIYDDRFKNAFGYVPKIEKEMLGTIIMDGDELYNRMSHGDTDSFFVKFNDIVKGFIEYHTKKVGIVIFDGHTKIIDECYDISQEDKAKHRFNELCNKYANKIWTDPENREIDAETKHSKIQIMYHDGIVINKNIRIIYNRFRLTDFCRIFDAAILEEKLDDFMLSFSKSFNYYSNELFLKREKCIHKALVTTKKKYICMVESNEDIVYLDKKTLDIKPDFAITGLEIVRSSTTVFSRERMLDTVKLMMDTMDKKLVRSRLLEIKREYTKALNDKNYVYISCPTGVKEEPPTIVQLQNMLPEERKTIDWRRKAASVWNDLIENDPILSKEPYEPVMGGEKMKFIKAVKNRYNVSVIAYSGDKLPERLFDLFIPDWEEHWRVSVAHILGRLFECVGWEKDLEYDETDNMYDLM
jgi:DNA polymerase elongation subunit (family B)